MNPEPIAIGQLMEDLLEHLEAVADAAASSMTGDKP